MFLIVFVPASLVNYDWTVLIWTSQVTGHAVEKKLPRAMASLKNDALSDPTTSRCRENLIYIYIYVCVCVFQIYGCSHICIIYTWQLLRPICFGCLGERPLFHETSTFPWTLSPTHLAQVCDRMSNSIVAWFPVCFNLYWACTIYRAHHAMYHSIWYRTMVSHSIQHLFGPPVALPEHYMLGLTDMIQRLGSSTTFSGVSNSWKFQALHIGISNQPLPGLAWHLGTRSFSWPCANWVGTDAYIVVV